MHIKDEAIPGGGHVVILGAGASIAATMLDKERFGRELPSMNGLPKVIFMNDLLQKVPDGLYHENFEQLYTNLHTNNPADPILEEMNNRIYEYFSSLYLPDKPTIYDYMVMALRPKDLIASFNWDPFLHQAWWRNYLHGASPDICFLHGNVAVGYNEQYNMSGPAGTRSRNNGCYYEPTPLLFPTGAKDYHTHPYIRGSWDMLKSWLHSDSTWRVTIFGYSAPVSDKAAIDLMRSAWGTPDKRNMEQFELIDVRPEEEVRKAWDNFIHTHHYDYCTNYFQSSLAQCPRRTNESYFERIYMTTPERAFHETTPIPDGGFDTFEEMWAWHQELIDIENQQKANP